MHETRGRTDLYRYEMDDRQHAALLDIIKALPCRVMISGYWTKRYAAALKDWNSTTFEAMTRGGRTATEWLWFNFPEPVALHDYRYLGDDLRERERIKRKKRRWVNRLHIMPTLPEHRGQIRQDAVQTAAQNRDHVRPPQGLAQDRHAL
jgi:DNA adenine methylase